MRKRESSASEAARPSTTHAGNNWRSVFCPVVLIATCFLILATASSQNSNSGAPTQDDVRNANPFLTFVRKISSAQDVKHASHPLLERTLDIIAGPEEAKPPAIDVLETPTAVTTDSTHRLYVADPAVHGLSLIHI